MSVVRSEITMGFPYAHSTGPIVGAALAAFADARILGARCTACERVNAPAREWCDLCGGATRDLVEIGPAGTVRVRADEWALIRLDGADTDLLHRVTGEAAEGTRAGDEGTPAEGRAGAIAEGTRVVPRWRGERVGSITDIECFEAFAPHHPPEGQGVTRDAPERTIGSFRRNVSLPYNLSAGELLSRFFDDIRATATIHGVRCTNCSVVIVPPLVACARCWAPTDDRIALPDRGIVTTFVVVNVPFHGQQMPLPYVLARILLDGADTSFLHVLGEVDHQVVRMGMTVEAVWREERTGFLNDDVAYFRPSGLPDADPASFLDRL